MTGVEQSKQALANRGNRDERVGKVVSDKGDKTFTMRCDFKIRHPKYGKYMNRSSKLRVHDEQNAVRLGDLVEVVSCRPISRTKCWRLKRILVEGPRD